MFVLYSQFILVHHFTSWLIIFLHWADKLIINDIATEKVAVNSGYLIGISFYFNGFKH